MSSFNAPRHTYSWIRGIGRHWVVFLLAVLLSVDANALSAGQEPPCGSSSARHRAPKFGRPAIRRRAGHRRAASAGTRLPASGPSWHWQAASRGAPMRTTFSRGSARFRPWSHFAIGRPRIASGESSSPRLSGLSVGLFTPRRDFAALGTTRTAFCSTGSESTQMRRP
jgi:hypothetical protein